MHLKFSKEDFAELDLADLLINVWSYSAHLNEDELIKTYLQWCFECALEKWSENYVNFSFVSRNLL